MKHTIVKSYPTRQRKQPVRYGYDEPGGSCSVSYCYVNVYINYVNVCILVMLKRNMKHMAEAGRWNKNGAKGFLSLIISLNLWLDYQMSNTSPVLKLSKFSANCR